MTNSPLSLPDFTLETYFSKWEFAAKHHLTASDMQAMSIAQLLEIGTEADRSEFQQLHLGYTPTWGTSALRDAVAGCYSGVDASEVLAFAGAGEALFWAMQLFGEAGDHVIVTVPNYQSIESIPRATGMEVDGLELWTGSGSDLVWTLDGLPGLRVGWIASHDRAALSKLERAKHYTSISNSGPSECLATIALTNGEGILRRNRELVAANDRLVAEYFGSRPDLFEYTSPIGGCVTFPRYVGDDGAESFCRQAVEDHGVFLLPSWVYRSDLADVPTDRFRIGIGRADVPQSLEAPVRFIESR